LHLLEHPTPSFGNEFAEPSDLRIPNYRLPWLVSQRGIPLLDRPGISNPRVRKARLHVEDRPVHPPTAAKPTFLDELVNPRIDHLNRKRLR
jgi:hypothetical protein